MSGEVLRPGIRRLSADGICIIRHVRYYLFYCFLSANLENALCASTSHYFPLLHRHFTPRSPTCFHLSSPYSRLPAYVYCSQSSIIPPPFLLDPTLLYSVKIFFLLFIAFHIYSNSEHFMPVQSA